MECGVAQGREVVADVLAVAVNQPVNAEAPAVAEPTLEEILVVGEQPGPAMWRVTKGDHTKWILATLEPLPRTWCGIPERG